jgi:hypothetical protein
MIRNSITKEEPRSPNIEIRNNIKTMHEKTRRMFQTMERSRHFEFSASSIHLDLFRISCFEFRSLFFVTVNREHGSASDRSNN